MAGVSKAESLFASARKKLINGSEGSSSAVLELRGKRSSATARSAGVGIAEFEATAVKAVYVVDGRALEMRHTLGIYVDLEVPLFQYQVAGLFFLGKIQLIGEARTASICHRHP